MNILVVNQSVIDMCASFFTLLTAVVEVDGTRMSHDSVWDQFVCRIWLTRLPLWHFLTTSTYGVFLMATERYIAVVYPVWYNNNVRIIVLVALLSATLLKSSFLDLETGPQWLQTLLLLGFLLLSVSK